MPHMLQTIAQLGGAGIVATTAALYAASYKPYQAHACPAELARLGKKVAADVGHRRDTTEWDCCELVIAKPAAGGHYDALALTQAFFGGRMFAAEMAVLKRMTRNVDDEAIVWQPLAARTQWSPGKRIANLFRVDSITTSSSDAFIEQVAVQHLGARMHTTLTLDAKVLDDDSIRYRAAYSNVDPQSDAPISRVALFLHRLYARILFQDAVRQLPL